LSTLTDTITVQPYQSAGGLAVEVSGLPVCSPVEHENRAQQYEIAAEAMRQHYPELVIRKSAAINGDGFVFWCEAI